MKKRSGGLHSPHGRVLAAAVAWLLVALALFLPAPAGAASLERAPDGSSAAYTLPPDQPSAGVKLELPPPPASFNTVDRGWIRFSYPPSTRERVEPLVRDADAIRDELSARLGQPVLKSVHVRIARTPGEMTTLAPEGVPYPKYAAGVAYSEIGLVLLTLLPDQASALHDVEEIFRHELAHVALHDAVGQSHRVPYWFNEGLAVHLSRESSIVRLKTLSTATLSSNLIPLGRLESGFPRDPALAELAYAQSADVVRFLLRKQDAERFPRLVSRIRDGQTFDAALRDSYGLEPPSLEYEWREDVARRYSFWPVLLSGTLVWMGVLTLFALGWRRKRQRARRTLEQWEREEALAELRRARADSMPAPRVHIVLPTSRDTPAEPPPLPLPLPGSAEQAPPEVPRVQHDGQWHTLH
jgi:hypothetical protein